MTAVYCPTLYHTILLLFFYRFTLTSLFLFLFFLYFDFHLAYILLFSSSLCPFSIFPYLYLRFLAQYCFLNSFPKYHFLNFLTLMLPFTAHSSSLHLSAYISLSTLNHLSDNLNEFPFIMEFSIYSLFLLFLLPPR
jgi:hypothetical protein